MAITAWPALLVRNLSGADVVYLDECQFLEEPYYYGNLISDVRQTLADGIDIVASGLDMDFTGTPFSITAQLAAMADQVVKLKAECHSCGAAATKSRRIDDCADRISLGVNRHRSGGLTQTRCSRCMFSCCGHN